MNLKQIETFVWLARLSSFRETAKQLRTTQPAISARIRELEEALGVPLFNRTSRRVRLSPQGRELLRYAERIAGLATELQERAGNVGSVHGVVRIGATHAVAIGWLPELMKLIASHYKGIEITLRVDMSVTIHQQLLRGEIDLAYLLGPIADPRLGFVSLRKVAMTWMAGKSFRSLPAVVTPQILSRVPILTDSIGSQLHRMTSEWFRSAAVEPRILHTCSGIHARAQLIQSGFGVGLMPAAAPDLYRHYGPLTQLKSSPELPELEYGLAFPLGETPPGARSVIKLTREKLTETIGSWSL
jgi:DNA-binding transcriptional LysR family regulator